MSHIERLTRAIDAQHAKPTREAYIRQYHSIIMVDIYFDNGSTIHREFMPDDVDAINKFCDFCEVE